MAKNGSMTGFTLLEVMIAIAILAIALTVLLGNQGQSIRLAEESNFAFNVSLLLRDKLSELMASEEELTSAEGDFGEDYPGYFWSLEVDDPDFTEYPALEGTEQFLQQVDLRVFTSDERKSVQVRRLKLVGTK